MRMMERHATMEDDEKTRHPNAIWNLHQLLDKEQDFNETIDKICIKSVDEIMPLYQH